MKIDMDNREGPLDVKVKINTGPMARISSATALELFWKFFADLHALLERAPTLAEIEAEERSKHD